MSKAHVTDMMAKAKRLPETDTAMVAILDKANAIKITYKKMHIFFLYEKPALQGGGGVKHYRLCTNRSGDCKKADGYTASE